MIVKVKSKNEKVKRKNEIINVKIMGVTKEGAVGEITNYRSQD